LKGGADLDVNSKNITGLKTTQTDVKASRAIDTAYRPSTSYPTFVNVTITVDNGEEFYIYVENDATPAVLVIQYLNGSGGTLDVPVSFCVPANWYYQIGDIGTVAFKDWFETTIGG